MNIPPKRDGQTRGFNPVGIFVYDAETKTELEEVGQEGVGEGEVLCRNRNVNIAAAAVEPRILTFLSSRL